MANSCALMPAPRFRQAWPLIAMVLTAVVLAMALQIGWLGRLESVASLWLFPVWVFVLAFFIADAFAVNLPLRRGAIAVGLSEIPLVLGLIYLQPDELILTRVLGGALAVGIVRRQGGWPLATNLAVFWLEAAAAAAFYRLMIMGADLFSLRSLTAAGAAVLLSANLTFFLTGFGVSLADGRWKPDFARWSYLTSLAVTVFNAGIVLLVLFAIQIEIQTLWLLLVFSLLLWVGYREYTQAHRARLGLHRLRQMTAQLGAGLTPAMIEAMLRDACASFEAKESEITLFGSGSNFFRMQVGSDGGSHRFEPDEDQRGVLAQLRLASRGEVVNLRVATAGPYRAVLGDSGSVLAAPLHLGGDKPLGLLLTRSSDTNQAFDDTDVQRMEVFALHLASALKSGELSGRLSNEMERSRYHASHDPVTEIPNRLLLDERLRQALEASGRRGPGVAVLRVGPHDSLVEAFGQSFADAVLREAAKRARAFAEEHGHELFRLEGPEFALIVREVPVDKLREDLGALEKRVSGAVRVQGHEIVLQALAGGVIAERGGTPDDLVQMARAAMNRALERGTTVVHTGTGERRADNLKLLSELKQAIDRDELVLEYQPRYRLSDGAFHGVEALVRWDHPERGRLGPDVFIPIAEWTGMIRLLTRWVFGQVLDQLTEWRRAGLDTRVAMKLSARDLADDQLPGYLATALRVVDVPADRVTLEVAESDLPLSPGTGILEAVRDTGVGLSVEHLGSGRASMRQLARLPLTELKLDRNLLAAEPDVSARLLRVSATLARELDLRVAAAGVENEEEFQRVREAGLDLVQGYYFARPASPEEIARLARQSDGRDITRETARASS